MIEILRPCLVLAALLVACGGGSGGGSFKSDPDGEGLGPFPAENAAAAASVKVVVAPEAPLGVPAIASAPNLVTFGVPLAKDWKVPVLANGRPGLGLVGADRWQFRVLDTWPGGHVKWASCDAAVTVGGASLPDVGLTVGAGVTPQKAIVTPQTGQFVIDTGPLQATVRSAGWNVFDSVVVDGVQIVRTGQSPGIVATLPGGEPLKVLPPVTITLMENGPAKGLLKVDGTLGTLLNLPVVDFSCRVTAVANSRDLKVDITVRNANIARPAHLVLGSLELALKLNPGSNMKARYATATGETAFALAATDTSWAYQAYSGADTDGVEGPGPGYQPHIPKISEDELAEEGFRIVKNGATVLQAGLDVYPDPAWANLAGSYGGATVAIQHMPYFWPAALEANGSGLLKAGVFTDRNAADYTFCWRQHESRSAVFSFHAGPMAPAPTQVALRLDNPVLGRLQTYSIYDASGVFPYDMVSVAEHEAAYAAMGISHTISIADESLQITRFLPAALQGGANNHDSIERRLVDNYLRWGVGGQLQRALDLALYKCEWQILRSDNFLHTADPGASNDDIPHSKSYEGDLEHRYRDGIIYAYYLTGDERFKLALLDETEILPGLDNNAHERSTYQTLRAHVALARFVQSDPAKVAQLEQSIRDRINYVAPPIQDIFTETSGFGWETSAGFGDRGFYVNSSQNNSEKPPGENYVTRGWISAQLGPIAYRLVADYFGLPDPDGFEAAARARDLATYTRGELFPWFPDPLDRHLIYSYAVTLQQAVQWETSDFHTILLGMATAWRLTGDGAYMDKALEQVEAFEARGHLVEMDQRLDNQHFMQAYLDWVALEGGP